MPWYRRVAWCFYHIILVLGMGRFQAVVSFCAWLPYCILGALQVVVVGAVVGPAASSRPRAPPCDLGPRSLLSGLRLLPSTGMILGLGFDRVYNIIILCKTYSFCSAFLTENVRFEGSDREHRPLYYPYWKSIDLVENIQSPFLYSRVKRVLNTVQPSTKPST